MTNMDVVALLCFVLAAAWVQQTEGYCCLVAAFPKESRGLFSGPCCNIFGCNCDNDCWCGGEVQKREAFSSSSALQSVVPIERFAEIDVDGNGSITEEEAAKAVDVKLFKRSAAPAGWFAEMDANGDGEISPHEFDNSL
ncbi:hypothetical protein AAVH_07642 [Aphelenchoides avenae]|nr:hypothetical protein AAVH_07642 [Aphelenchus avenae]